MKSSDNAWKIFEKTGAVEDYLNYCALTAESRKEETEGKELYAALDRWNRSENPDSGE